MMNLNSQLGESTSIISTRASLINQENSEYVTMYNNYGEDEGFNHHDTVNQENPSRSFLTEPIDMNAKYLALIHQSPPGWHFVSANLKLMAAGKANLDVVLYVIETFMQNFSLKPPANIENLKNYFESLKEAQRKEHQELFRKMAELILDTPKFFQSQISLLVPNELQSACLTQRQCLCLVMHMFMCISVGPRDGRVINFENIFYKDSNPKKVNDNKLKMEKIKCIINYFIQALKEKEERKIIFERISAENIHGEDYKIGNEDCSLDAWKTCNDPLVEFSYHQNGGMESSSKTIEIGFSGKSFGGHTLRRAATQQEIIILKSPECLPGFLLFYGEFGKGEASCITGARSFNRCLGYDSTFQLEGSDDKARLELARKIVFIDASDFSKGAIIQFEQQGIQRELTKAFIGFLAPSSWGNNVKDERSVTTGRWGSGTNGGNVYLKFIIQWIAASRAKRRMEYYAFDEPELEKWYKKLWQHYKGKEIKDLVEHLLICAEKAPKEKIQDYDLFTAMKNQFDW